MNEPNEKPRHYRWPWVVAAVVLLGIILAIIWVRVAVKKIESERYSDTPSPATTPAH